MKLYELAENYRNLQELVDREYVDKEVIENALDQVEGDISEKLENIAKLMKSIDGDINSLKVEEERLANKRKLLENNSKKLREYIQSSLIILNTKKIKTNLFNFIIRKNTPSVNITDENLISDEFIKIEKKIEKKKVLEALKSGIEVPGAEMKQSESLQIK